MMRLRNLSIGLLLAAGLALLFAGNALACSCAGPPPGKERAFYREAVKESDGAIIARVQRVRIIENDPKREGDEEAIFSLRVRRSFKRHRQFPEGRVLRIRSSASGASCGLDLKAGDVDGLLLYRYRGRITASLCSQVAPKTLRRAARSRGVRAQAQVGRSDSSSCLAPRELIL